ncbi:MAG: beta-N-acetylglucosaminidase domain-containing protein, partial [bacterium]
MRGKIALATAWVLVATGCGSDGGAHAARGAFRFTGAIEGFYGPPYAAADRLALIDVLAESGLDHYVYAPKNDPFHRSRWREPYPADQ